MSRLQKVASSSSFLKVATLKELRRSEGLEEEGSKRGRRVC
jgi:hypothetical protein